MNKLITKSIILRRTDYGEADRIITFLSEDFGRISAMAKGVRRQKSKMAGGIELFSVAELQFIKGRGDMGTIVSTRLLKYYSNIVKDLERTELAYNFLKIIDRTVEDSSGSEYFPILNESLAALDDAAISAQLSGLSFTMRVLQLLGHVPHFGTDQKGNKLTDGEKFDFDLESVAFVANPGGQFGKNHIKLLKLLAFNPPQAIKAIMGAEEYSQAIAPLARNLLRQYVPGAY